MAKNTRKVYTVVGMVSYECEDVLGIYTSKDAALKAAKKVATRPADYLADYTNYDVVYVYAASLNVATERLRDEVWKSECMRNAPRSLQR